MSILLISSESLTQQVSRCARQAGITPSVWERFMGDLAQLSDHAAAHYAHSLRVGLYAHRLACYEHQTDIRFPLFGGCGHDLGKCDILIEVLDAPDFGPEQFEQVKQHVFIGYNKLKGRYPLTACICGLHHRYQPNGYGIDLDTDTPFPMPAALKAKVETTARLVYICDFFDALTTRHNQRSASLGTRPVSEIMAEQFPDQPKRTTWLCEHQIAQDTAT